MIALLHSYLHMSTSRKNENREKAPNVTKENPVGRVERWKIERVVVGMSLVILRFFCCLCMRMRVCFPFMAATFYFHSLLPLQLSHVLGAATAGYYPFDQKLATRETPSDPNRFHFRTLTARAFQWKPFLASRGIETINYYNYLMKILMGRWWRLILRW